MMPALTAAGLRCFLDAVLAEYGLRPLLCGDAKSGPAEDGLSDSLKSSKRFEEGIGFRNPNVQ
jgi:hypothetical protein